MLRVLAVALLLAVPAALASTGRLAFSPTFGQARLEAEGALDAQDSQRLRGLMDAFGDRDGNASAQEADAFVASSKGAVAQSVSQAFGANTTLDGHPLVGTEPGNVTLDGAPGPVDGGSPIGFRIELVFLFTPGPASTHALTLEGHATPGGALRLTVEAPPGWHIAAADVAALASGTAPGTPPPSSVAFTLPTDGARVQLTFEPDAKGGPAPGALAGLVVLAAGGLLLRGRNGRPSSRRRAPPPP